MRMCRLSVALLFALLFVSGCSHQGGVAPPKPSQDAAPITSDDLLDRLERLGLADDPVVVLVSDHGEEFWERGWLGHTRPR